MLRAFLLIQVEAGMAERIGAEVALLDRVLSAAVVTGPYDVIARAEATSIDELGKLVLRPIQRIEGVIRTMTCPILERSLARTA
ncbi:MAG TPA: Lrp/AsnC ligand binding domain-containing protein [Actinomycetota bacterium]